MIIILVDESTIRLDFPYSPTTVEAVKGLLGSEYDKEKRSWTTRLCHLRRLLVLFPGARIEQAVIEARLAQWGRIVRDYNSLGVYFAYDIDCETVVPVGEHISPLLQDWTKAHSLQIAPWLSSQRVASSAVPDSPQTVPTASDSLLWRAVEGGAKAEERKKELAGRRKFGKREVVQMGLGI